MSGSKYYDSTAVVQVIGCTLKNPSLLEDSGKYFYGEQDFVNSFHRTVFGCIYNLKETGATHVTPRDIENYLDGRPEAKGIYEAGHGSDWVRQTEENADLANFDYYYNRMKKMTLIRAYDNIGLNMKWLYDPDNIFDEKKKKSQLDYLDSLTLNEISDLIEIKMENIKSEYIDNATDEAQLLGLSIECIMAELLEKPDIGAPLYGRYVNSLHRGARLGKYYIRSAASGVGKSRTMIADACYMSCTTMWQDGEWVSIGDSVPVLFITTELDISEISTMAVSFISGVNEQHILTSTYDFGEPERVKKATTILSQSKLYIEEMPDFTMKQIENCIKRSIRVNKTQYIFFDYLHSSLGILQEVAGATRGTNIREDNILFMFSVKLKDIANQYNVFIMTSTQLNEGWKTDSIPDQNLLRGAKAIADRCDWGSILLDVTDEDREKITSIVDNLGCQMPNVKMSVYKNRRGSYNKMYLWMYADKGTCRFDGLFATDYECHMIPIKEDYVINLEL